MSRAGKLCTGDGGSRKPGGLLSQKLAIESSDTAVEELQFQWSGGITADQFRRLATMTWLEELIFTGTPVWMKVPLNRSAVTQIS